MAKQLKDTDGFMLHGWMANKLHLSIGELFAYALVHQFSQSNAGVYIGGPGYLQQWLGCAENTARKYLHTLVEKGLIINEDQEVNGVLFRHYRVNYDALRDFTHPLKNLPTPPQDLRVEYKEEDKSSIEDINTISKRGKFDFRKALIEMGVEPEIAEAWMAVRKTKRATNTKVAFDAVVKEIAKSGLSANDCIRIAAENSWQGFRAEWLKDRRGSRATATKSGDKFERMMAVGQEIFGKPLEPIYDEQ